VNGANLQESVSFKETVICPRCLLPAPTVAPTEPAGTALPMALPLGTAAGTLAALPRPLMLMRAP
ncbi:MAG TPA: twin-arginine translocase subunit TatB, partial [Thermoplasmata archaeon]|nr:twin-arginine translocase subunit TatB [Thermoplasmata archaeon]